MVYSSSVKPLVGEKMKKDPVQDGAYSLAEMRKFITPPEPKNIGTFLGLHVSAMIVDF